MEKKSQKVIEDALSYIEPGERPIVPSKIVALDPFSEQVDEDHGFIFSDLYDPRSKYSPEEKMSAVIAYVLTGSAWKAEKITGLKAKTIQGWKQQAPWWPEAIRRVRKQKQDELDGRITGIINKALDEIEDRVMNGDEIYDGAGRVKRRRMTGQQLASTLSSLFDKRALVRGDPTARTEKVTIEQDLKVLADRLEKMAAKAQLDEKRTIDVKDFTEIPPPEIED